jgi:hypothetical protein
VSAGSAAEQPHSWMSARQRHCRVSAMNNSAAQLHAHWLMLMGCLAAQADAMSCQDNDG